MSANVSSIDNMKYKIVEPYIKKTLEVTNNINNPHFIDYDNKRFFVCSGESSHIITTNNSNDIDLYTYFPNNSDINAIIKNDIQYVTYYSNDLSYVTKTNLENFYTEQLRIGKSSDNHDTHVFYIQEDLKKDAAVEMRYDNKEFSDEQLKKHLWYITGRFPDVVYTKENKKKNKYILNYSNSYNPFVTIFNHIIINEIKEYEFAELIPDMKETNLFIPVELIDIFNNNYKEFNDIKEVSNIYKKVLSR